MRLIDIDNITALDIMHNVICDKEVAHKMLDFLQSQPTIQPQGIDKKEVIEKMTDIIVRKSCNLRGCEQCNYAYEYGTLEESCEDYVGFRKTAETFYEAFAINIFNQQPTSEGWIPCDYAVPASPSTEDTFRDILIKRKTGGVVTGWYNLIEDTWMKHTEEYGIGDRLTDAVEWKYPQPYKESE